MMLQADNLSALDGIRHGFFTRRGGVSTGSFGTLNCGLGSGDDLACISENRQRVAHMLGANPENFCTLAQVHGKNVQMVDAPWGHARKADAMVSNRAGMLLGILTADCAPILLADEKNKVIGAAHAGWRGALAGIIEATVDAMEQLGAEKKYIIAAIGPCIAQSSYEVDESFRRTFEEKDRACGVHFIPGKSAGKYYFDIGAYGESRLKRTGIVAETLNHDTCADDDHFFSYRRATLRGEKEYGRQVSAIMLT